MSIISIPIAGMSTLPDTPIDPMAKRTSVFSTEYTGELDCVGLLLEPHTTQGIFPYAAESAGGVLPEIVRKLPFAIGVKNHIANGKTTFEGELLGSVLNVKTSDEFAVGDPVYFSTDGTITSELGDYRLGLALSAKTGTNPGLVKVSTEQP